MQNLRKKSKILQVRKSTRHKSTRRRKFRHRLPKLTGVFVQGDKYISICIYTKVQVSNLRACVCEKSAYPQRQLALNEYQPFNMLLLNRQQIIDKLREVLNSIDVGGEQSRQFASEIRTLDKLLKDLGGANRG